MRLMQGCKSCRIYGRLMSVQGYLNLVLACRIVRPPEAIPDRWSLVERLIGGCYHVTARSQTGERL